MAEFHREKNLSWSFTFEKEQYEPFLDFIKGICIIWVIWEHTMGWKDQTAFWYWGKLAVPLFLLIQTFHVFKRGINQVYWPNWSKVSSRVVIPFIIVAIISLLIQYLLGDLQTGWLKSVYKFGIMGPGGYYPLVYVQFAVLIPLLGLYYKRYGIIKGLWTTLCISILLEILCAWIGVGEWFWRLLSVKYILLIRVGYIWSEKIRVNTVSMTLALVSMVFIYLFEYQCLNFSPLFYDSEMSWRGCHWICYFYPIYILPVILYGIYISLNGLICRILQHIGKASYEIFLMQMLIIGVAMNHRETINAVLPHMYLPLIWIFCFITGYLIYYFRIRTFALSEK